LQAVIDSIPRDEQIITDDNNSDFNARVTSEVNPRIKYSRDHINDNEENMVDISEFENKQHLLLQKDANTHSKIRGNKNPPSIIE